MVSYKPYSARFLAAGALLVIGLLAVHQLGHSSSPTPVASVNVPAASADSFPQMLSDDDSEHYQAIFRLQKAAKWKEADGEIAKLSNKILVGQALAERYLHRHYDSTPEELRAWLSTYGNEPQADDIYDLAIHKSPELKHSLTELAKRARLQGYGDSNMSESRFDDLPQAKKIWKAGLEAWRAGDKSTAGEAFAALAKQDEKLTASQYAAACFWAYRAFDAVGDHDKADDYLHQAALNADSFYGILARKQLDQPLTSNTQEEALTADERQDLLNDKNAKLAIAFAQAGLIEHADETLRQLFPDADKGQKWQLLKLARELDLASVEISMAKQLESDSHPLDFAKYPVPRWKPQGGFSVDPALLYALMRQESGFRPSAIGPGGSLGLMQLMPQTASMMQKEGGPVSGTMRDPVRNMTLGERYVEHLLANDAVSGNLFFMLAAYNAGPAHLQEWQDSIDYKGDPLLFVESIPYATTRHYVMQVMANYWVYSERIGNKNPSVYSVLQGKMPVYSMNMK